MENAFTNQGALSRAVGDVANYVTGIPLFNRKTTPTTQGQFGTGGALNYPGPSESNVTPQATTPLKSTTLPDGTKHEYHAPTTPGVLGNSSTKKPETPITTPTPNPIPTTPQVGTPAENAQNVLNQSNLNTNPEYQKLATQQNALVNQGYLNPMTPYAGNTQSVGQSVANTQRPQSTGNLAGELGLLTGQMGAAEAGNAAEAQRLISGGQLATTGATNVMQAGLPGQRGYGTTLYAPFSGQDIGGGASTGGAFGGGQELGKLAAGQTSAGLHTAYGAAQSVGGNLTKLITDSNINPTDPQFTNSINQFLQTGVASNPKYQQFYGTVNDYIASLAPILGVGGNQTDQKTSMASQMVSQMASGKSIVDTIKYFDGLAADKINAYDKAGGGGFGTVTSGSTTGSTQFGWNG